MLFIVEMDIDLDRAARSNSFAPLLMILNSILVKNLDVMIFFTFTYSAVKNMF